MARIKIDVPENFSFTTTIPVRITDLNYGGHVGNDAILSMIHEARIQFLQQYDYTELNMEGIGLIMSDVAIEYKQELFYGDALKVSVVPAEFSRVSFDLFYRLEKEHNGHYITIAVAKTGMVCYSYDAKKVVPLPDNCKFKN